MKKYQNIFYLVALIILVFATNVTSINGECSNEEIAAMRKYATNINLSYDYYIENDEAYFNITVSNLIPQLYVYDRETGESYFFEDTNDGEFIISGIKKERGEFQIISNLDNCLGQSMGTKNYVLPSYNKYYSDNLCEGNREHSLCQKWKKTNFTYDEFEKTIKEYIKSKAPIEEKKEDKEKEYKLTLLDTLADFYMKYYYIILPFIIITCITVMIINVKKNKFNL